MKRILIGVLLMCMCIALPVKAAENKTDASYDILLRELDFGEIDDVLKDVLPEAKIDFGETVRKIINGETKISVKLVEQIIYDGFFYEFGQCKKALVQMILIAIVAAVFTNFSGVLKNRQVGEIGFCILYMLLITICLTSFRVLFDSAGAGLEKLLIFMRALGPVYFLSVALASGSSTSVVFYNLIIVLIYLVELLILNFLLPLLHIYLVVKVLNHVSKEEYLSRFSELIEWVIVWSSKSLLYAVVGLNLIQGLIAPAIDSLKRGFLSKGMEVLPAIGDAIGGVTEVVLGTAVLVKNGIGVLGMIICIIICAVPIIRMFVLTFSYKLVAALIQPVSDGRIVGCIGAMGETAELLLRMIFVTGVLFLLTIAVVSATTT